TADRNHQHCEPVEGWMFECANSLFERLIERADKDEAERQLFVALYITPRRIGMVLQIVDSIQVQGDGLDIVRHNAELIAQIRSELRPGEAVDGVSSGFLREMLIIRICDPLRPLTRKNAGGFKQKTGGQTRDCPREHELPSRHGAALR